MIGIVWRYCEFQLIPCAVFDLNSSISYRTARCIIRIGATASNTFKAFKLKHSNRSIQVEMFEVESFVCECSVQIKQGGTPALESKAAFRSVQRCLKAFEHQATCERLECEHCSMARESMANEHGHWNMAKEYGKWVWQMSMAMLIIADRSIKRWAMVRDAWHSTCSIKLGEAQKFEPLIVWTIPME